MKRIKCINKGCNSLIAVGEVYDVERENENAYFIRVQSNYGSELIDYKKELFVECEKEYTLGEVIKEYEGKFVGQFKRVCDGKTLEWRRDGVLIWSDNRLEFGVTQFALTQKYTKVEDLEVTYVGALKELEAGKSTYCIFEDNKTVYDSSSRAISLQKLYKGKWYIKA